jgi:hypothetical protein
MSFESDSTTLTIDAEIRSEIAPLRPKHSWKQFSLRTFFIFVTIIALGVAWLVSTWKYVREQRTAVASLQKVGGNITYNYEEKGPRTWTSNQPPQPEWLRKLLGPEYFDRPSKLSFKNRQMPASDDWVDDINTIGSFKTLMLWGSSVTDKSLELLAKSDQVVEMHLNDTTITNKGIMHLKKFPSMKWLLLRYAKISDEGVRHLAPLEKLKYLDLTATNVTDEIIPTLAKFKLLKRLDLCNTLLTPDGALELKKRLPNCDIDYRARKKPAKPTK